MSAAQHRILVLGLGNDILADDAVGLLAARRLRGHYPDAIEIVEAAESGLSLLDFLEGRSHALLLDAIVTGRHPAGTVLEYSRDDFHSPAGFSSHYAGLPEVLRLAECLALPTPAELRILAMEVEDPYSIREGLSAAVAHALPRFVARARQILDRWSLDPASDGASERSRPPDACSPPSSRSCPCQPASAP